MNEIITILQECHRLVWQYRAELEPYWPTPTTDDALLFAFTELGEAVDAHLRSKPEYARNRDKDLDVLDELADCAMMLLTALEDVDGNSLIFVRDEEIGSFPELAWNLSMAMVKQADRRSWDSYALFAAGLIVRFPDMDLPARLTARLNRIKAKRMPKPKITIDDAYAALSIAVDGDKEP